MISYVLIASIWSTYGAGKLNATGNFVSYEECRHGAKMFLYESVPDALFGGDGIELGYPGGIRFTWHCEGYVR